MRSPPIVRALARVLAAAAILHAPAAPAVAQVIRGTVVADGTGQPLNGALVTLLDAGRTVRAEAVSGENGRFRLAVPASGAWIVMTSLIGYATIESRPLNIGAVEEMDVEIRMAVEAVPIDPLIVRSRINAAGSDIGAFYARMERGRRSGLGHFIGREEVDRLSPIRSTDLLRMAPGVRVLPSRTGGGAALRMAGGCTPAIYVDGMQVNRYPLGRTSLDDIVPAFSIEGVEVYRGAMAQVAGFHDPTGCGLVLVWTRRGAQTEEPWSWRKFLAGAGLFAAIFLLIH